MSRIPDDQVEVYEESWIEKETDRAVLAQIPGEPGPRWIPKSCLGPDNECTAPGEVGDLHVKRWFAIKEGLPCESIE